MVHSHSGALHSCENHWTATDDHRDETECRIEESVNKRECDAYKKKWIVSGQQLSVQQLGTLLERDTGAPWVAGNVQFLDLSSLHRCFHFVNMTELRIWGFFLFYIYLRWNVNLKKERKELHQFLCWPIFVHCAHPPCLTPVTVGKLFMLPSNTGPFSCVLHNYLSSSQGCHSSTSAISFLHLFFLTRSLPSTYKHAIIFLIFKTTFS